MIPVEIHDGYGSDKKLRLGVEGEVAVSMHSHPPKNEETPPLPFRKFMTLGGDGVTESMLVDGSATPQEFCILAEEEKDVFIKSLSVVIVDAGATLNEFGNLAALTNGVELSWITAQFGEEVISDSIKTNWEFMRLAGGNPPIGGGTDAFRANNVAGTSEGYTPFIDFTVLFGIRYGLRLRAGTTDKLCFIIKDNISTMDQMDVIAYGFRY